MRQHTNSFDLIRLIAASFVLWSHQHALMGLPEPAVAVLRTSFGGLGVWMFFAVSGYLNTLSATRHRSAMVFLWNRALRIYPALIVCVAFTVALGFFVSSDLPAYLGPHLVSYIAKNVTLFFGVRTGVPGIFEGNIFREALNGSLWSLPYEVKMYVVLAACLAATRYWLYAPVVIWVMAGAIATACTIIPFANLQGSEIWVVLGALFLSGSAVAATRVVAGLPIAISSMLAATLLFALLGSWTTASGLFVTAIVIATGSLGPPSWLRPPLDISYGVYLYAFPVQQVSAMLFADFWLALGFSTVITFLLATASALFVERRALKFKSELPSLIKKADALTSGA
jgi:peptidoglycan/LPS O-acetylase OafA/YrhL